MEVLLQRGGRDHEGTYKGFGGKPVKVEWRRKTTRTGDAGIVAAERAAKASRTKHNRERRKTDGRGRVARHRNRRKAEQCAVAVAVQEVHDTNTVS